MSGVRKAAGIVVLAAVGLLGIEGQSVARGYRSARAFVCYYRSLEPSTLRNGLWERVALSLVLASADSPELERADKRTPAPPSL
jgi:hypothetical protein